MKQKPDRLPSTIIIGIFILLMIAPVVILIPFNYAESVKAISEQASASADNQPGATMGAAFATAFGAIGLAVFAIFLIGTTLVPCAILLIFSIKNIKAETPVIKYFNICYTAILGAILILDIVKMILFLTGVA